MSNGNMGLDANERLHVLPGCKGRNRALSPGPDALAGPSGPRFRQATSGLRSITSRPAKIKVYRQMSGFGNRGTVQSNPWMPGEIVFCWETGGKGRSGPVVGRVRRHRPAAAPIRGALRNGSPTKARHHRDEAGHRHSRAPFPIASATATSDWGNLRTFEHPTGVAIVNLRTR